MNSFYRWSYVHTDGSLSSVTYREDELERLRRIDAADPEARGKRVKVLITILEEDDSHERQLKQP